MGLFAGGSSTVSSSCLSGGRGSARDRRSALAAERSASVRRRAAVAQKRDSASSASVGQVREPAFAPPRGACQPGGWVAVEI